MKNFQVYPFSLELTMYSSSLLTPAFAKQFTLPVCPINKFRGDIFSENIISCKRPTYLDLVIRIRINYFTSIESPNNNVSTSCTSINIFFWIINHHRWNLTIWRLIVPEDKRQYQLIHGDILVLTALKPMIYLVNIN